MNRIAVLLIFTIFQSCLNKNEKQVSQAKDDSASMVSEKLIAKTIPIYNFTELEPLLNKKNDTTYVVNFWATWCKPCVMELPAFEKITLDYSDKKVIVLLVSLDFPDKIESQVMPFIKKRNVNSEVVLLDDADANSWIPKVSNDWSGAIPATVIYKNNNRKFYEQSFSFEELETELKTFL